MSGEMDSVDTYSSGTGAYGAMPFTRDGHGSITAYIGKDGYLYAYGSSNSGYQHGDPSTKDINAFFKVFKKGSTSNGYFYKPIDYSFGSNSDGSGMIVDQEGKVWNTGNDHSSSLGRSGTTAGYFMTVATNDSGNYLPSNYQAVAVSAGGGGNANMILTSTGALYGAGKSTSLGGGSTASGTFTRLDTGTISSGLPAATASNPIIDFAAGAYSSYVLYKDGSLYHGSSTWTKMNPSGVTFTMMDYDGRGLGAVMAVSSANKIYYAHYNSTTTTLLDFTPTGTVAQVRGGGEGYGWGYLNTAGNLYLAYPTSNAPALTFDETHSNVSYFDIGGNGIGHHLYGIIQSGVVKFWGGTGRVGGGGDGSESYIEYSDGTTPSLGGGVDNTYSPTFDISNTPPAIMIFRMKNNL